MTFAIKIPNPKPTGKHLKIVLTWESSPSLTDPINDLSDLDLNFTGNSTTYIYSRWDSNVEIIDVDASQVTAGNTYNVNVPIYTMRISAQAYSQSINSCIAWTWVKDHAQ
jgi:hypothetical protein